MAEQLGIEPRVEADLREVFLGEWEGGLFRVKVAEGDPAFERAMAEERWDEIPGAERQEQFAARVADALARIHAAHPDQRVVVVSHGGVIGQILASATKSRPFAFMGADNASISHIVSHGDTDRAAPLQRHDAPRAPLQRARRRRRSAAAAQ